MNGDTIADLKKQLKQEGYNIYVYSYPGGMYFPIHTHNHDTIHVVLSGMMRVRMDDTDHYLEPGTRFVIPANVPHSAEVVGESPVVCIDATKPG